MIFLIIENGFDLDQRTTNELWGLFSFGGQLAGTTGSSHFETQLFGGFRGLSSSRKGEGRRKMTEIMYGASRL